MNTFPIFPVVLVALLACNTTPTEPLAPVDNADTLCFDRDVLPIFLANCARAGCHDPGSRQKGYNFTSYAGIIRGVTPGNPLGSLIYIKITEEDELDRMPPWPKPPLAQEEIDIIQRWIVQGATDRSCIGVNEPPCDTGIVTFSQSIRPILNAECIGCHSVAADTNRHVDLSSYEGVKSVAESGQLYGSVTHSLGYSPMPHADDTLSKCQILLIQTWIDEGALNN